MQMNFYEPKFYQFPIFKFLTNFVNVQTDILKFCEINFRE